ncbi:hypothetical protein FKM82_024559 [Ascaphus truei]
MSRKQNRQQPELSAAGGLTEANHADQRSRDVSDVTTIGRDRGRTHTSAGELSEARLGTERYKGYQGRTPNVSARRRSTLRVS